MQRITRRAKTRRNKKCWTRNRRRETIKQPKEKPKEEPKEETKKEQKEEVKDKPKEEQKEETKESEPASNPEQDKKESGYITRQEFTIKARREIEKILTQPNYVPNPQQYHGNMGMGYQQPHQVYPPHYVAHGAIDYGPHGKYYLAYIIEKTVKERDIMNFKNKSIIKDVAKFMRVMHVQQNPKNSMKYSLYHIFRKRDPKRIFKN